MDNDLNDDEQERYNTLIGQGWTPDQARMTIETERHNANKSEAENVEQQEVEVTAADHAQRDAGSKQMGQAE